MPAFLPVFPAALWWGSLSAIYGLAVPVAFAMLPAGGGEILLPRLASAQCWLSVACGVLLIFSLRRGARHRAALYLVFLGLLTALLLEFAAAPRIAAGMHLRLWYGVAVGVLLVQWFCAAVVLGLLAQEQRSES